MLKRCTTRHKHRKNDFSYLWVLDLIVLQYSFVPSARSYAFMGCISYVKALGNPLQNYLQVQGRDMDAKV